MRVALVGYGAVADIHARILKSHAGLATVYGPDSRKAAAFAERHCIAQADTDLNTALSRAEIAFICSPSALHYEQASVALNAGLHVLIELPACTSTAQAEDLAALATKNLRVLQCAHTSRTLEPYQRLTKWMQSGALGEIRHAHYVRAIPPRTRSWTDDALWHHAAHAIDLFLLWFGALESRGCVAYPGNPGAQDLCLIAAAPANAPVALSISYTSRLTETKMTVIGTDHAVATDGFTYISSDKAGFQWQGIEQVTYENAIRDQDIRFLEACGAAPSGIPWEQTVRLIRCLGLFLG